jgi:hypothetical protein
MADEAQAVGRAATVEDLPVVAECLASAFYEDPLWATGHFPTSRAVGGICSHS